MSIRAHLVSKLSYYNVNTILNTAVGIQSEAYFSLNTVMCLPTLYVP